MFQMVNITVYSLKLSGEIKPFSILFKLAQLVKFELASISGKLNYCDDDNFVKPDTGKVKTKVMKLVFHFIPQNDRNTSRFISHNLYHTIHEEEENIFISLS